MKVAGQFLVPIGVVANCNVMRNALQRSRFRFDSGAKMDPLGDRLVTIFSEVGVPAKAKIKIRYGGAEVEADVLAVVENHLFAFECKNSLHPCNTYELRQSYDYILKAAAQLDNFQRLFADEKFRRLVSNLTGFDVASCVGFTTCIVTGNRMFSGHRESGHAVENSRARERDCRRGLVLVPFPKDQANQTGQRFEFGSRLGLVKKSRLLTLSSMSSRIPGTLPPSRRWTVMTRSWRLDRDRCE